MKKFTWIDSNGAEKEGIALTPYERKQKYIQEKAAGHKFTNKCERQVAYTEDGKKYDKVVFIEPKKDSNGKNIKLTKSDISFRTGAISQAIENEKAFRFSKKKNKGDY